MNNKYLIECIFWNTELILALATIGLFAASIGLVIVTWLLVDITKKISEKSAKEIRFQKLKDTNDKMLEFSIQYPELENNKSIEIALANKGETNYDRYLLYCVFVFNYLEDVWNFYNRNKKEIENYIYVEEIVRTHRKWWQTDPDNEIGYSDEFKSFINQYLEVPKNNVTRSDDDIQLP